MTQASVDVGGVALRYADSVNATAATVTPDFRFDSPRGSVEGVGTLSQFTTGGWSSQGSLASSAFTPQTGRMFFELAGFAGGSYHHDGTRTGEVIANGRMHLSAASYGAFAGGGIGSTWNVDGWRKILIGEIGGWARFGPGNGLLTVSPISVDDTTKYVDGQVSFATSLDRFDIAALAGYRWGSHLPADLSGSRSWISFTGTSWLSERLGLVAAAGTYPVDPTQGFPGGRFVSLGLRLASARRNRATLQNLGGKSAPETPSAESTEGADSFQVSKDATGHVVLRFHAPTAKRVEITGDFSQWTAMDLERGDDGWWTRAIAIPAGNYQMNLRVDGADWIVPRGMLSMKDEFGGVTGLLVVE